MPYLGNPVVDRFTSTKAASVYSGDGSTVAFTLEHSVGSDEDILVSVDGVIQEPSVAYAVSSGTTLTFTAAPSNNAGNNIFVYYLFRTIGTVTHPPTSALSATSGTFSTNVGIGNASPNANTKLDVNGAARIGNNTDGIMIENNTGTFDIDNASYIRRNSSSGALEITSGSTTARNMIFNTRTNGAVSMTIDSTGAVTKPLQPAFSVKLTQDQANIATGTLVDVLYATEIFDQNNDFNHTNYTFTAPVTGKYQLNINLYINSVDSAADNYYIRLATTNRSYYNVIDPDFGQDNAALPLGFSVIADMDASDTALVKIHQTGGTAQTDINANTYFTGCLLA